MHCKFPKYSQIYGPAHNLCVFLIYLLAGISFMILFYKTTTTTTGAHSDETTGKVTNTDRRLAWIESNNPTDNNETKSNKNFIHNENNRELNCMKREISVLSTTHPHPQRERRNQTKNIYKRKHKRKMRTTTKHHIVAFVWEFVVSCSERSAPNNKANQTI